MHNQTRVFVLQPRRGGGEQRSDTGREPAQAQPAGDPVGVGVQFGLGLLPLAGEDVGVP